ncbi:AraC family transcriptional regulator [Salipaludibacillus sp. CUR1]|uniref:helix-turn-helix domain-containing protein n=1 Tax=Salipaludibacillus sp. CUR1 TaxID=2820003 RepID=UPI001E3352ED|nr:AraC family transcriptional regulator [Salipaludibacillus sp. CUR1]MCE7793939.1 AraC family transcriptional regulator [Salipaludibacillus sp. CUR1]
MSVEVGFCGYSHHKKGYQDQRQSGLTSYLFRLQIEGTATITHHHKTYPISKGDLFLGKPGDPYRIFTPGNQDSIDYHIFCQGSWIDQWWESSRLPAITNLHLDEKLLGLWRHLTIEERRPKQEKNPDLARYLLQALCLSIEQSINDVSHKVDRPFNVTQMMRYIEEQATTSFKVEDVAAHVNLSVSRAVHLFKEHTGQTIIQYALDIRLATALNQMQYSSMTLEHIAENCGFNTYPYFHRVFKKHFGQSPGQFRRQQSS